MICGAELIFNQYPLVIYRVLAKNISAEWPNVLFGALQFKLYADSISKAFEILFFREPGREVSSLIGLDIAGIYFFQSSEV